MKPLKSITLLTLFFILTISMNNCSSAQKMQKEAPADFGEVYFQKWTAGVRGGGSGINLFIPINNSAIELDSVYIRGKAAKLETKPSNPSLFIGRFKTEFNQPKDIIISSDMNEEAKNKLPEKAQNIPFELKPNECVVSYRENEITQYYKITGIQEKQPLNYPSAPPNRP